MDWWIDLPTTERTHHFTLWWASLSPQRQAEARTIAVGQDMPRWMWRTLIPYRRRTPTFSRARTGQVAVTLPTQLRTVIHTTRPGSTTHPKP